jgi:hypothetical protein
MPLPCGYHLVATHRTGLQRLPCRCGKDSPRRMAGNEVARRHLAEGWGRVVALVQMVRAGVHVWATSFSLMDVFMDTLDEIGVRQPCLQTEKEPCVRMVDVR